MLAHETVYTCKPADNLKTDPRHDKFFFWLRKHDVDRQHIIMPTCEGKMSYPYDIWCVTLKCNALQTSRVEPILPVVHPASAEACSLAGMHLVALARSLADSVLKALWVTAPDALWHKPTSVLMVPISYVLSAC